ncbi:MAG: hypothetical protein GY796_31840 [Chloroflexi bacterium]|nr:hypothetical protein [Chloroflexota bacterium]
MDTTKTEFTAVKHLLRYEEWSCFQFVINGRAHLQQIAPEKAQDLAPGYFTYLDEELEQVLSLLDEDTAVVIITRHPENNSFISFILAVPNNPLPDQLTNVHPFDIAPTLLTLAGCKVPSTMQGNALVLNALSSDTILLPDEEEALLRERSSGLGYIYYPALTHKSPLKQCGELCLNQKKQNVLKKRKPN